MVAEFPQKKAAVSALVVGYGKRQPPQIGIRKRYDSVNLLNHLSVSQVLPIGIVECVGDKHAVELIDAAHGDPLVASMMTTVFMLFGVHARTRDRVSPARKM